MKTNANDLPSPRLIHIQLDESRNNDVFRGDATCEGGLTKREHFASMVLQGYCSFAHLSSSPEMIKSSVQMADALIAELNKEAP